MTLRWLTVAPGTTPSDILGLRSKVGAASRERANFRSDQMPVGTHRENPNPARLRATQCPPRYVVSRYL
jgi:hypothetical protein